MDNETVSKTDYEALKADRDEWVKQCERLSKECNALSRERYRLARLLAEIQRTALQLDKLDAPGD